MLNLKKKYAMKTIKFFFLILVIVMSQNINAQIKLLSTGKIAIGSTTVPTNYYLNVSFNIISIGAGGTKPTMSYDLTPYDPRIWSSS